MRVNEYNQELLLTREELSLAGDNLPVRLQRIYHSYQTGQNSVGAYGAVSYTHLDPATGADFTGGWAVFQAIIIILVLTAGTALIMWLGEPINETGIGNGISLILFAGIVSRIPTMVTQLFHPARGYISKGGAYYALVPIVVVCVLLMLSLIHI